MKVPNYPIDDDISNNDILLGTDADDANKTKNFRISDIISHIVNQSLVGATGPQGPAGEQGEQGEPGTSPTLPLEFNAQIYQDGTANPIAQVPQIDTISQGTVGGATYREITFARTGVGTYRARLLYETSGYVDTDKCSLMFGDAVARITATSNGTDGGSFYKQWTFQTYNLAGAAADSQLAGNNGTYVNVKIYN